MIPFHNAMSIAAGVGGNTFADWVAHAASRVPAETAPLANIPYGSGSRFLRTLYSPAALSLTGGYGGPWQYWYAGTLEVLLCHAMISAAAAAEQKVNNGVVIYCVSASIELDFVAPVTRNGVTTNGYDLEGNPGTFWYISEASYWDFTLGKARTINPGAGTGPVDYSNAGWTP